MITAVMIFLDIFIRILHRFYRMILHVMGPLDVCTERSQRQSGDLEELFTERVERYAGQFEALDSHMDSDDRDTPQDPRDDPTECAQ